MFTRSNRHRIHELFADDTVTFQPKGSGPTINRFQKEVATSFHSKLRTT